MLRTSILPHASGDPGFAEYPQVGLVEDPFHVLRKPFGLYGIYIYHGIVGILTILYIYMWMADVYGWNKALHIAVRWQMEYKWICMYSNIMFIWSPRSLRSLAPIKISTQVEQSTTTSLDLFISLSLSISLYVSRLLFSAARGPYRVRSGYTRDLRGRVTQHHGLRDPYNPTRSICISNTFVWVFVAKWSMFLLLRRGA